MKKMLCFLMMFSIHKVYSQDQYKEKSFKINWGSYNSGEGNWSGRDMTYRGNSQGEIIVVNETEDSVYYRELHQDQITALAKTDFMQYSKTQTFRRFKGAKVGVFTVPFRLRGVGTDSSFDFESSLSLSSSLALGFGSIKRQYSWLDLSLGIGLTAINLTKENSLVLENRSASAFTLSLGVVVKFNENANMGFFIGRDFLGKVDRNVDWIYNGKTWLGLGINISFNEMKTDVRRDG